MFAHYHLIPTDDSAWSNLLPRKMLKEEDEFDWAMMYRKIKNSGHKGLGNFLNEISLHDVRLDPNSIYGIAQQTNLEYLLSLDVDRLVWSFRKTAGLESHGQPYGGWEAPNIELRGHFVGHYLSASAQTWASTHNESLREKMSAVVSALSACQQKIGSGYLSAFPSEFFDRFEAIKPVWAPYYTIHKILAGLLDQYTLADTGVPLNDEVGGMNDVLYRLYSITANPKHLVLAHLFDKPCFLGLLSVKGFHANTHIPVVVGAQMRYEITGDPIYKEIGKFFMDIVNSSHAYATGGTSVNEFWSDPKRLASTLQTENEESCTTYNMLKRRGTDIGVMIYMLPLRPGGSKAHSSDGWGTKFDSFWCCYGTGIESFSKLGDSIYFEEQGNSPGIYIIQYIPSSLDWKLGQIKLSQIINPVASWDNHLHVTIPVTSKKESSPSSTLILRIPTWTSAEGAKATLNGKTFVSATTSLRTEAIKDDRAEYASVHAILYGPYLLAGLSRGDWDINTTSTGSLSDWITPIPSDYNSHLISLSQTSGNGTFVLANSNQSIIKMEKCPEAGTDSAIKATFRLISRPTSKVLSEPKEFIGQSVMLEPFDYPGTLMKHWGKDESIVVETFSDESGSSEFRLVSGLDGKDDTVSLESEDHEGCFIYSGVNYEPGLGVKLGCSGEYPDDDDAFKQAASFKLETGISQYHPISFVAKGGSERNFLLVPLYSLRDESYTVYFNIHGIGVPPESEHRLWDH
nr:uncharacterized protein LOC109235257 isoform X2 [Ipomoea batatas]